MKKFIYNVQWLSSDDIEDKLRVLGSQGWELVSVTPIGEAKLLNGRKVFNYTLFFKQEVK